VENVWPDSNGPPGLFETEEEVPPAPSLDEIRHLLQPYNDGDEVSTTRGVFRLVFDGQMTTQSGAEGQLLRETTYCEYSTNPVRKDVSDGFLARLLQVRPDLREKAASLGLVPSDRSYSAQNPVDCDFYYAQFYLHGYAWEKTQDHIGTYGDLDLLIAWKFLDKDLSVGHGFTHQLVPELTDDVFLNARVVAHRSMKTELGEFDNCVECIYMVDYGVSIATDETGHERGYWRSFDFASVVYAPDVGPIYCYERHPPLAPADAVLDPSVLKSGEFILSLIGTNACEL
jgi:hypothetical protein